MFIVFFMINQHGNGRVILITTRGIKMFEVYIAGKVLILD